MLLAQSKFLLIGLKGWAQISYFQHTEEPSLY